MKNAANSFRNSVTFMLNGELLQAEGQDVFMMTADFLRRTLRKTGTKIVCAEGDCGACSVLLYSPMTRDFLPINSCIYPVGLLDGCFLVTVEGLAKTKLNTVQTAMVQSHGSQCGYCTPGFVITLQGLVEKTLKNGKITNPVQAVKNSLTGNLCRCTGYTAIIDAGVKALQSVDSNTPSYAPTAAQIKKLATLCKKPVRVTLLSGQTFYAPTSLKAALQVLSSAGGSARSKIAILGACTDLGVSYNKGATQPEILLSLHKIKEFLKTQTPRAQKQKITIGALTTIAGLRRAFLKPLPQAASYLDLFAAPQIKNVATVCGNLANASPIGDCAPLALTLDATFKIAGLSRGKVKTRTLPASEFFIGYRKTGLNPNELITHVEFNLPDPKKSHCLAFYKISNRKDLDISNVNAGFLLTLDAQQKILSARVSYGGVAATPLRLKKLEQALQKSSLQKDKLLSLLPLIQESVSPQSDARASQEYRRLISQNLFKRFLAVQCGLEVLPL